MRQLTAGSFAIALLLAGCASQPTPQVGAQAAAPQPESVDIGGRWKLATPNAPSCGMHFERPAQVNQGSIKPEGGCPGKFFTSRHWALSGGQLTISDHNQLPLALLKFSDGQFTGKSSSGTPIILSRDPTSAS